MGVYIPNMEKSKRCGECDLWSNCFYPKNPYTEKDDYIADDCPIIDIVTCEECKHRDPEDKKCDCGQMERQGCIFPVADDYFCKYGERRADGDI